MLTLSGDALRDTFDATAPLTLGLEEEVFLLDPETLDLAPVAAQVLEALEDDPRAKLELPAAQAELVTRPHDTVGEAIDELEGARIALCRAARGLAIPAALSVHPFAEPAGPLNEGPRYEAIDREFGWVVRRQLVGSLQVHVAVGGAERTLAVYNALRGHLPELAALAAAAPYYEGVDTGLASVRPAICTMLPRQGLPPEIPSWDALAEALAHIGDARRWWYELRPHPAFGTLELRVPDTQPRLEDASAVAAYAHSLVAWLSARYDAGEELETAPTWLLLEQRWSAAKEGVRGPMGDVLAERLDDLHPYAVALGCADELGRVHFLAARGGADALREAGDARSATRWAAERFLTPPGG